MGDWIVLRKMVRPAPESGKVVKVDKEVYERIADISATTSIPIQRLVTRFIDEALKHTKIIETEE